MRKFIVTAVAATALAVPALASADAPDGTWTLAPKTNANASSIGYQSSQITQNGQYVSGNGLSSIDQTTTPGSRADAVQGRARSLSRTSRRNGRAGFGWPAFPPVSALLAEGSSVVVRDIAGARFVSRYHPRIVERARLPT